MEQNKIKLKKMVLDSLLEGTPTAAAWIFSKLIELGEITIGSFLSPSIYADPRGSLDFSLSFPKSKPKLKEKTIRQNIWRLRKYGFVEKRGDNYFLSPAGITFWKYVFNRKKTLQKKWDKKYRLVIFDIPENKAQDRSWLRQELYILEYKLLQKSVFIGKAPLPSDLIRDIRKRKLSNYVNYILAEKIYKNTAKK